MQFPAGEIGRKLALTVTPHVDDSDHNVMTPDKFIAREFPVGTGLLADRTATRNIIYQRCTLVQISLPNPISNGPNATRRTTLNLIIDSLCTLVHHGIKVHIA